MRRTDRGSTAYTTALTFPPSAIDIFATMLLVFAVNHPAFHVDRRTLPTVRSEESPAGQPVESRIGYRVELKADGTVLYQGRAVALDSVAQRIAAEPNADWPIQLQVATDGDGRGALGAWLQLQVDLAQANLWGRVQIVTRPDDPRDHPGDQT